MVNVNWDDDDNSEGPGVRGKIDYKSDFQDPGPIPVGKSDDDFIQLRLGKAGIDGMAAHLAFDDTRLALWRNANRTDKVVSGQTEVDLAAERTIYTGKH